VLENALSNYEASGIGVSGQALASTEKLSPVERWYAVSVRPRHEKLVVRHLEHQGLNCFLPVYRSVRRWKDRRKELDMALFPGYVFVNLDARDRSGVLRAPGVLRFVTFQGQPAAVPDSEIRALESSMSAGLRPQPHPYLHQGRKVRVKRGPLMGAEGIMIRRKDRFRLVLSIDLIMRSVMFEVDEADVEPL
jgi:transcription elongation factor/antiterminator RfaH